MPIDYRQFIHESDKEALEALRKMPGFTSLCKKFTQEVTERHYKILNMSSRIKLGPNQMPEIYNLLPPICEKFKIVEPELYLALDRSPNACTIGDTSCSIIINSGLIETMTPAEIQGVLAHECGHILCRHVLYHTMGSWLFMASQEVLSYFGLLKLVTYPLLYAFYYWIRCSEFSADRAAAYFYGGSNEVVDTMMRLAGGTSNLNMKINRELFLQQAKDYKFLMNDSTVNKLFELWMIKETDHPLLAYRAYEINEWCKTEQFNDIKDSIPMLPDEYLHETSKNAHLSIQMVTILEGKEITEWFKERAYLYGKQNIAIHCGIAKQDFSYLKKMNIDINKAVYQAIMSKDNEVLAHRVISFNEINKTLENLFVNNDGVIIVE